MWDAGCGIRDESKYGAIQDYNKISRRKQDLLILADGMRDSFKIEGWVRDEKQKI